MPTTESTPLRVVRCIRHPAVLAALLVLLIGNATMAGIVRMAQQRAAELLRQEAVSAATAVARALGQQLTRAVELGIPLAEIPGMEPYLADTIGRIPALQGATVRDVSGRILFATGTVAAPDALPAIAAPIGEAGREVGEVTVIAAATGVVTALRGLYGWVALAVLGAALAAGLAVAGLLRMRLEPARIALIAALDRIAGGDFTPPPTFSGRDAAARASRAVAALCEPVNARYRALLAQAEAIRAIDFDGSLSRRIDPVLAGLSQQFRFGGEPESPGMQRSVRRGRLLLRSRVALLVMLMAVLLCVVLVAAGLQRERLLEGRYADVAIKGQQALWRQMEETETTRLQGLVTRLLDDGTLARIVATGDRTGLAGALAVSVRTLLVTGQLDEIDIVNASGATLYSSYPGPDRNRILDAGSTDAILRGGTVAGLHQESAHRYLLVVGFPIRNDSRIVGAGTVAVDIERVLENFARALEAPAFLISLRGRLIAGTDARFETSLPSLPLREASVNRVALADAVFSATGVPIRDLGGGLAGLLVTLRDATASLGEARRITLLSLSGAAGFLLAVLVGLYLYLRGAFRPLDEAIGVLRALARGDTSVNLETERRDEIGRIAEAVRSFRRNAMALTDERRRHESQRHRQERFIRKQMEALAAALDSDARQRLLDELQAMVDRQGRHGAEADGQLGLLAGVLRQLSGRIVEQHQRLSTLVVELRESLVTKTKLAGLQQELEIARRVQEAIVPTTFPDHPMFSVHGHMVPAREVGGDFYDFFTIDEDHLGVVIADVSGKGVPAALFMAITRTLLKATALYERSPAACVTRLNDLLAAENEQMMFVTLFYGVLHLPSGRLTYANAGHNPPYVIGADGEVDSLPATGGMAVAVFEGQGYRETVHVMHPNDTLFLYTDGVTEAFDADGEEFGETRLEALLAERVATPVADIAMLVVDAIRHFERGAAQADDITCLSLRYNDHP